MNCADKNCKKEITGIGGDIGYQKPLTPGTSRTPKDKKPVCKEHYLEAFKDVYQDEAGKPTAELPVLPE